MKEHTVEQGSAEWFALRMGRPTASAFHKVLTPARAELASGRWEYACQLVAERLLNWQSMALDTLEHIAKGKEREPQAVQQLEFVHDLETRPVGFLTTDDMRIGASPDRVHQAKWWPVEVKCPADNTMVSYLLAEKIAEMKASDPKARDAASKTEGAYRCQRQGQLWVAEADTGIFYAFHPRTPEVFVRTDRDEAFIRKLADALDQFCDEVDALTEEAKRLGAFQPYVVQTPHEVAHGPNFRTAPMETAEELDQFISGAAGDRLAWGA